MRRFSLPIFLRLFHSVSFEWEVLKVVIVIDIEVVAFIFLMHSLDHPRFDWVIELPDSSWIMADNSILEDIPLVIKLCWHYQMGDVLLI